MNSNLFRLELFPNELLIELFQYFHPRNLFQIFYNLNFRFNSLLQSFHNLSLTLSTNDSNKEDFFPYIRVLVINRAIDINLNHFIQIRHLILRYPTEKLLAQLNSDILPCLEHLCVNHMHISLLNHIPDICETIFSNTFPNLKSCYIFKWETITKIQDWTQSSSLRILKIGKIDLFVYKSILSSCPNLYFLQLATIISNNKPLNITHHQNLKRLIIKTTAFVQPWKDDDIKSCLEYVPSIEYLSIHRTDMRGIPKYDWLPSIINYNLPFLCQLDFYFHSFDTEMILEPNIKIKEKFKITHLNRYQSRLTINRV